MLKIIKLIIFVSVSYSAMAFADPQLESVNSSFKDGFFETELNFDSPVDAKNVKVEFINQTVQVDIPNANFETGKNYQKIDNEKIKSVLTYQPKNQLLRTRVIYNKPFLAKELEGLVDVDAEGHQLRIKIFEASSLPIKPAKKITVTPSDLGSDSKSISNTSKIQSEFDFKEDVEKTLEQGLIAATNQENTNITNKSNDKKSAVVERKNKKSTKNKEVASELLPVFSNKQKKSTSSESSLTKMLISLGVIAVFALALTLFGRWWSKGKTKTLDTTKIRVLTQHYLGPKKSLLIVQVAGESILIGMTDQNINMIKSLSLIDDEVPTHLPNRFDHVLDDNIEDTTDFQFSDLSSVNKSDEDREISSIKKLVNSKLKGMRSI